MRAAIVIATLFFELASALELGLARRFFAWFQQSAAVSSLHHKHIASETVVHMLQNTPFAAAPDEMKRDFARGAGGAAVAKFMQLEQQHIGEWKRDRIVEAAGTEFDAAAARAALVSEVCDQPVVLFSFVDCPWCLLAKEALQSELSLTSAGTAALRVVELEDLGRRGKELRAAIALATSRTSMPSIWIGGRCVGGYTDGTPTGDAALCVEAALGLQPLVERGSLRGLLRETGLCFNT
jgi:glutaredoxin